MGSWKEIQGRERSGSGEAKLGLDPGEAFVEDDRPLEDRDPLCLNYRGCLQACLREGGILTAQREI